MSKLRPTVGTTLTAISALVVLGISAPALADKPVNPGMKVQVDKDTGKLRKANAAEAKAMDDATQRQLAADWWDATVPGSDTDGVVELADGTKMKRMSVDSLEAFAIRIDEDGKPVAVHTDADGEKSEEAEEKEEVDHDDR